MGTYYRVRAIAEAGGIDEGTVRRFAADGKIRVSSNACG